MKFYGEQLNLKQNELKEAVLELVSTFPANSRKGRVVYNTVIKSLFVCINGEEDGADTTLIENWRVGRISISDLYSGAEPNNEVIVTNGIGGFSYADYIPNTISDVNCTNSEQVNDAVYISSDSQVSRAIANSKYSSIVFGFIKSKQTSTKCTLTNQGLLSGFTGLIAGRNYFLSSANPGQITINPPTGTGNFLTRVGIAYNTTTLFIEIDRNIIIRQS